MIKLNLTGFFLLILTACTSTEALGNRAIEYNKELEESTNITLLTNVVRSSIRTDMSFSRLGSMSYTGSLGVTPSASFGVGANADAANDTLGLSIESNDSGVTTFEALSGQKYHRAINKSISAETVSFYRDRGWSDALLFTLFIEKIYVEETFLNSVQSTNISCEKFYRSGSQDGERTPMTSDENCTGLAGTKVVENSGVKFHEFDNDPDRVISFQNFRKISGLVIKNFDVSLEFESKTAAQEYYPEPYCTKFLAPNGSWGIRATSPFSPSDCTSLKGFEPVMDITGLTSLDFSKLPKNFRVLRGIAFKKQKRTKILKFTPKSGGDIGSGEIGCTVAVGDRTIESPESCKVKIVLRSPKDMIYFLGELVRAQSKLKNDYASACGASILPENFRFGLKNLCAGSDEESLFYLNSSDNAILAGRAGIASDKLFAFEYDSRLYWISRNEIIRGRTMQLVSLLNELFYLNQEASDAPTVSVIQGATIQ